MVMFSLQQRIKVYVSRILSALASLCHEQKGAGHWCNLLCLGCLLIIAPLRLLPQGLSPQKLLTQYTLRSWSTDEGSPSTAVLDILQSRDRYLWLATFNGLARFDGSQFTAFNRSTVPSIRSAGFYCLCQDSSGAIWAGSTSNDGLYRFANGNFIAFQNNDNKAHPASSTIHSLLFVSDPQVISAQQYKQQHKQHQSSIGTLWIGTSAGLQQARIEPNNAPQIETVPFFAGMQIWALHLDSAGNLWVGTRGKGIYVLSAKNHHVQPVASRFGTSANAVSFTQGRGDTLWVAGMEQGLGFIVSKHHITDKYHYTLEGASGAYFRRSVVRKVFTDRHRTLWIGMVNARLARYSNGLTDSFTLGDKLTNVEAISEDIEGNIWIGTYYTALTSLSDGKFTNYTTLEGLSNSLVHHIYKDRNGSFWIGTNKGLHHLRFSNGNRPIIRQFTLENKSLPDNTVRHIVRDKRGRLWIATFAGVVCWDGKRKKTYTVDDGLSYNEVRLVFEDNDGKIWVGTRKGLNVLEEKNGKMTITRYSRENMDLQHDYFLSITQDSKGTMWFGTDGGGVIAFRNGVFRNYTTSEGLPANVVFQVLEDSHGKLWFATVNGLARMDDERRGIFSAVGTKQGLSSAVIFDILQDNNDHFWLTTPDGVIMVSQKELEQCANGLIRTILFSRFTKADGMSATECTGASKAYFDAALGRAWFPTLGGVSVLDTRNVRRNTVIPAVYIEKITADNRVYSVYDSLLRISSPMRQSLYSSPLPSGTSPRNADTRNADTITLPAGTRSIEFSYTGLSMMTPTKTRFRFRLEGFDTTWIDVGTRRKAYYTNLPPNVYRFRVIACNNDEMWNTTGMDVYVNIEPYFFQTWWFLLVCAVLFTGIVYALFLLRVWQLRAQKKALLHLVEKRTKHIREQNEEILRQQQVLEEQARNIEIANSEILESNAGLQLANAQLHEISAMKNEMIRIVAHDLKNPLSSIILSSSTLERYTEKMSSEEIVTQIRRIRLVGERMTKIITDLLDIDALDSGTMKLDIACHHLAPLVAETLEELSGLAANKQIILHFADYSHQRCTMIDKRAVQQIVTNLVSNAIKFSPSETRIFVRIWNESPTQIRFSVQDQGPGITPEDTLLLFKKFTRLSARPTGGEHSSGLGLNIVKRLVESMDGTVWCESEAGKGATFIVELPSFTSETNGTSGTNGGLQTNGSSQNYGMQNVLVTNTLH
jgi:signal transduction histidine kinase/ligand-binding sensor domain-containing protein